MKRLFPCLRFIPLFAAATAWAQTAPVITSISAPRQVVAIGQSTTLTVTADSASAPSYQWKHNGRAIPAATGTMYAIANATPSAANGWYQAVVANASGTTESEVVFVNVAVDSAQLVISDTSGTNQYPVPADLTNIVSVAAGDGHWLALEADGSVAAWGDNRNGQSTVPPGLLDVVAIAATNYCSFALKADGTVVAWGASGFGETPVPAGLNQVVSIAAGQTHVLALKADGTVSAWGWNGAGQISPSPDLKGVVGISAGYNNSYAWKADGTAVGWGSNVFDQAKIPAGLTHVVDMAAGEDFAIALTSDGMVTGWGRGYSGGQFVAAGLTNVVGIAAGVWHGLALNADGMVVAWGSSAPVAGATNAVAIAAKELYSIVLRRSIATPSVRPGQAASATTAISSPQQVAAIGQSLTLGAAASGSRTPTFQGKHKVFDVP